MPNNLAWWDERRNYDRVYLTRGMIAADLAGNKDALPVMRKFYDWMNVSPACPLLMKGIYFGGSAHNSCNGHEGSLLMYASRVGKPEDLVTAERYFIQDYLIEEARKSESLSLGHYPFHIPHSYVLLAYAAWLDHYRLTGAPKYLEAALGAWKLVYDDFLHIGGSLAICEAHRGSFPPGSYYLNHPDAAREQDRGKAHTGETRGSVFWTEINHKLLQFFPGEVKYADEIERSILNVVLAAQDEKGRFRYHNQLVDRKTKGTFDNTCCEVMGQAFIGRLPQDIYSVAEDGVYVNLFVPSSVTWRGLTLKQETAFPAGGKVDIRVMGGNSAARRQDSEVRVQNPESGIQNGVASEPRTPNPELWVRSHEVTTAHTGLGGRRLRRERGRRTGQCQRQGRGDRQTGTLCDTRPVMEGGRYDFV